MALEFDLQSDADIDSPELRAFLAGAVEGDLGPDGTVFRPGMYVMSRHVAPGDEDSTTRLFGFQHRINATFRFANLAAEAERDHNTAIMIRSVLALAERFGGHGVLLFNGELAVVQWTPEEVVFDSEWEEWSELDEVKPLLAGHALRPLPQPLM